MMRPMRSSPRDAYSYAQAENAFTWEGGFLPHTRDISRPCGDDGSRMLAPHVAAARSSVDRPEDWLLRHAVRFDGRSYAFSGYRYDRLADAIAHVVLTRARPALLDPPGACFPKAEPVPMSVGQREAMAALGIVAVGSSYCWKTYRYDRLDDAVAYAELMRSRGE